MVVIKKIYTIIAAILFAAIIFCSNNSFGQTSEIENRFSFGPKIGFNIGSPIPFGNIPEGAKGKPIAGLNLGVFANYKVNDRFEIQIEVLYTRKGSIFNSPLDSMAIVIDQEIAPGHIAHVDTWIEGETEGKFDNFYLEIPVLFQMYINEKFALNMGAYYAYFLHTNTTVSASGSLGYDTTYRNLDEYIPQFAPYIRKHNAGILFGAHYSTDINLDFDARISYGLTDLFNDDFEFYPYTLSNFFAQITLMYRFGEGRGRK